MTEICLNVRDFGALGDGQTDDTSAFEAALKEAAEGCVIHFLVFKRDRSLSCYEGL